MGAGAVKLLDWLRGDDLRVPCPEAVKPKLPLFCGRSGHPLVRESSANGFDQWTGQPRYFNWLHCPLYKGEWLREPGTPRGAVAREVAPDWSAFRWPWYGGEIGTVEYIDCAEPSAPKPSVSA